MSLQCPQLQPRTTLSSPCSPSWYPSFQQKSSLSRISSRLRSFPLKGNAGPPTPTAHPHLSNASTVHGPPNLNPASNVSRSRTPGLCWYHDNFGRKASKCDPPARTQHKTKKASTSAAYFSPNLIAAPPSRKKRSNLSFLIDTGADVSVIPAPASLRTLPPILHFSPLTGPKYLFTHGAP
ncbi:hypothetical protein GWK47_003229 [Chionoecetes opilio]|uniref:Peptidase A2 domain-containing protein n=1 Tax=Chionoecetes opilio TaxID=41210 RepID=A0A8J8WDX1_CHIOP|nr:hypothetical protein GWK47_003229 [Chionoecetes opilio]